VAVQAVKFGLGEGPPRGRHGDRRRRLHVADDRIDAWHESLHLVTVELGVFWSPFVGGGAPRQQTERMNGDDPALSHGPLPAPRGVLRSTRPTSPADGPPRARPRAPR